MSDIEMHHGKFTLYTNADSGFGWQKIEVKAYGIERREHVYDGQDEVLSVHFVAKGRRRTDETHNHFVVITKGHGLPDAPSMWGKSSTANGVITRGGRYSSSDPRWSSDLNAITANLEIVFERRVGVYAIAA